MPGDMNQVVGEVAELMQSRASELKIALEWHAAEGIPILTFDPEAIHRAVLNVATNALDACADNPNGRVAISTQYLPDEALVRIVIEDNGVGIAEEDLDKIFTLFVSHKGGRGTGLGLPVSQKILKEHGGQIQVTSQLGVGSRFTLELPAVLPSTANQDAIRDTGAHKVPNSSA
jgi:two-component system NtrC family sensor kinase